jgi:hypothetical protein
VPNLIDSSKSVRSLIIILQQKYISIPFQLFPFIHSFPTAPLFMAFPPFIIFNNCMIICYCILFHFHSSMIPLHRHSPPPLPSPFSSSFLLSPLNHHLVYQHNITCYNCQRAASFVCTIICMHQLPYLIVRCCLLFQTRSLT